MYLFTDVTGYGIVNGYQELLGLWLWICKGEIPVWIAPLRFTLSCLFGGDTQ